ncbi:MAG TPA: OmpA family protein [Planctomycetota bacterium]|nr:OmpA family protein [Planctomycetota bacterium]
MDQPAAGQPKGAFFLVVFVVILGLLGYAYFRMTAPSNTAQQQQGQPGQPDGSNPAFQPGDHKDLQLVETQTEVPSLGAPATYQPKDDIHEIELSEYAGYAGIIVANGGLEPNENSVFGKKGLKLRIKISEEESWPALNGGKMMASATTADVLAVYGKQFQAVVPAQIGFSRGADGIVVRKEYKRVNALKGKTLVTSQFTEADFFIRYLAGEASIGIHALPDLNTPPNAEKINLVYAEDAFKAGDVFLADIKSGKNRLAGCVTWDPRTTEVVKESGGKAHLLTSNKNLLIVADILVVNKGFAQKSPDKVAALVHGTLEGNRMVRDNPDVHLDTIAKAFNKQDSKWDRSKAKAELAKVHLSNLPENLAFFSGAIDMAGSFGSIYQSAIIAYGSELIKDPVDSDRFADLQHLNKLKESGEFKDQQIAIAPIRAANEARLETDPLLSRDIRFLFQPNSAVLELTNNDNIQNLEAIRRLLKVSPGSTILLRGHVDDSMVDEFRRQGGEALVNKMALEAVELSKKRANEIKNLLITRLQADPKRLETIGLGWREPVGASAEQKRRVEVQWFTVE